MHIAAVMLLLALVVTDARAAERAPTEPLVACQVALARAGRRLGDHLRHEIGTCLAFGVECLTADGGDLATCCATAADRCGARAGKIAKAKRRYLGRLQAGRCARLRFNAVTAPDGLGFERAAQICSCLEPDVEVHDLSSLAACLARLNEVETTRLLAITEAPRAGEALTCVGLDQQIATLERSVLCTQASPTPEVVTTASATAAITPHASASPSQPQATMTANQPHATVTASQPSPPTRTATAAPPAAPTSSATASAPSLPSPPPTLAPSRTPTATRTPSRTATGAATAARTATRIPTASRTATPPPATRTVTPTARRTPIPTATPTAICGNGIVEDDEECDGNAFDDSGCFEDVCTCEDFCDDAGGRLACARNCTIDFSRCTAGGCEF